MTLRRKLSLFLLAASLAPVAGIAFPILAWAQREVAARSRSEYLARAEAAAGRVAADLADADAAGDPEALVADPDVRGRLAARLDAAAPEGGGAWLAGTRALLASRAALATATIASMISVCQITA
ncbi:MAG TPA: hypothetical protein VM753_19530 [Anaeromyxobacter sp.]|nr:hypothetical protein [Anaeromyxobacter sp.]